MTKQRGVLKLGTRTMRILQLWDKCTLEQIAERLQCTPRNVRATGARYGKFYESPPKRNNRRRKCMAIRVNVETLNGRVIPLDYENDEAAARAVEVFRQHSQRFRAAEIFHTDGQKERIVFTGKVVVDEP